MRVPSPEPSSASRCPGRTRTSTYGSKGRCPAIRRPGKCTDQHAPSIRGFATCCPARKNRDATRASNAEAWYVVARGGLEPPHTDPESAVLPLDDRARSVAACKTQTIKIRSRRRVIKCASSVPVSTGNDRRSPLWTDRLRTRRSGQPSPESAARLSPLLPFAGHLQSCLR
jgi:hypothetical protein